MTAFGGETITYDEVGNPLSYYNGRRYNFTWENGRRLETATVDGVTLTFTYNASAVILCNELTEYQITKFCATSNDGAIAI